MRPHRKEIAGRDSFLPRQPPEMGMPQRPCSRRNSADLTLRSGAPDSPPPPAGWRPAQPSPALHRMPQCKECPATSDPRATEPTQDSPAEVPPSLQTGTLAALPADPKGQLHKSTPGIEPKTARPPGNNSAT